MITALRWSWPLLLALLATPAAAQEDAEPAPEARPQDEVPEPPPPPGPGAEAPVPEKGPQPDLPPPTVTIRREEGKVVEEYSMGGQVYMVRVTPENAPPYFLVDMDGDGELERSDTEVGPDVVPPHWVIFEWE